MPAIPFLWGVLLAILCLGHVPAAEPSPAASKVGSLSGQVLDTEGKPVPKVCVWVARQDNGDPLTASKRFWAASFLDGKESLDLAFAVTDAEGRFRFEGIPEAEYRVVSQSWRGAKPIKGLLESNGEEIHLHGAAERVKVTAETPGAAVLRPLGRCTLAIDVKCGNNDTLLVVSTAPTRADPILAFAGWSGPFARGAIGGNRMPLGKTFVSGLPEGTVYLATFAPDNSPGWGAAEAKVRPGATTSISFPFVASWSDGQHEPPEHLAALVKELQPLVAAGKLTAESLFPRQPEGKQKPMPGPQGMLQAMARLAAHLDDEVELPTGRKARLADALAAIAYAEMQRAIQARGKGVKPEPKAAEPPKLPSGKAGYEAALRALHDELGRHYPCFAMKNIDWKAVGDEILPRAKQAASDEAFGLLVLEMVARLEDSHAAVVPALRPLPEPPLPRWDPGLACLIDARGKPVVYYLDRDGPAEKAGVKLGATIESVDGQPAEAALERWMKEESRYVGYSSRRYLRYHAARFFLRRPERGREVRLTILTPDGQKRELSLEARLDVRYLPRLPVPIAGIRDSGDVSWTRLEGGIGYVYVRRIGRDLIPALDRAVGELKDVRGLIVDVRGNSGGGFESDRAHRNFDPEDKLEPERPRYRGPIALVLDSRCISAGEGWASWFVAKKRARSFGETTAGASSRKTQYALLNGYYRVTYPVKAYTGYLDRPIERQGLEPDVPIVQTAEDLAAGRDTVLEAAKKYLLSTSAP
jgi:carboxyl-terminal processing protease